MKGVRQHDERDCGIACIATICQYWGMKVPLIYIRNKSYLDKNGLSMYGMLEVFKSMKFNATALKGNYEELQEAMFNDDIKMPFIAHVINDCFENHYIVIKKVRNNKIMIFDPAIGTKKISLEEFKKKWTGYIVTIEKDYDWTGDICLQKEKNKYLDIIKNNKNTFCMAAFFSVLLSVLTMVSAFIYQKVIDEYILGGTSSTSEMLPQIISKILINIDDLFVALLIIYVMKGIVFAFRGVAFAILSKKIELSIKSKFADHFLKLPLSFFNDRDTGEIMNRFDSTVVITDTIVGAGISILLEIFMLLAAGSILFFINSYLFFMATIIAIIYIFVIMLYRNPLKQLNKTSMEQSAKISAYMKESIDGLESIKCISAEQKINSTFTKMIKEFVQNTYKINFMNITLSTIIMSVEAIVLLIILFLGSNMVIAGSMSLGTLIMFESFVSYFITPVKTLVSMQPVLQEVFIAFDRIDDVLETPVEDIECNDINNFHLLDDEVPLKISNLSFRYGYAENILNKVTLSFEKGQKVYIVGESGSGKSTLAKLLAGLQKPTYGDIFINGINITEMSIGNLRKEVVYTPQNAMLFSGSVRDNITLGVENVNEHILEEVINVCGIADILLQRQWELNSIISEGGRNLSGGERQRIAIARSLLRNSSIYIFDESTNQMDKLLEKRIMEYIKVRLKNAICLFIMHDTDYLHNADRIIGVAGGQVKEIDKCSNIV